MEYFHIFFFYICVIVMAIRLLPAILGKPLMKNKPVRRKHFIYIGVVFGEIIFFTLLSLTLNISILGTWLTLVIINLILLTTIIMLIYVGRIIRGIDEKPTFALYFIVFLGILILAILNPLFIATGF